MLLRLSKLLDCPGGKVDFQTELDLHEFVFGGGQPVNEPVAAKGSVRNEAGVLLMDGTVTTTLHGQCDRCAAPITRPISFPLHAVLTAELENEQEADQWTFLLTDDCADLDDIVTSTFVLNMDSKLLCKPDCKGLCCRCGKNLNEGPCDCRAEIDPRWAALQTLLTKD